MYPALAPTKWRIEIDLGAVGGIRITDVPLNTMLGGSNGVYFFTDYLGRQIDSGNAWAECLRRAVKYAGAPQTIELGPGVTFVTNDIGGGKPINSTNLNRAWWGAPASNGPFSKITDVQHVSMDLGARGTFLNSRVFDFVTGAFNNVKNYTGAGPLRFQSVRFGSNGSNYCFETSVAQNGGLFPDTLTIEDSEFFGVPGSFTGGPGGVDEYDMIMAFRGGLLRFDIIDCVVSGAPKEWCFYTDAVQGDSRLANTTAISGGLGSTNPAPGPGRGFCQFVQRARPNFGLETQYAAFGQLNVQNNVVTGAGFEDGSSAYTFVGHLGSINFFGNQALLCHGGQAIFWCDSGKGMHTTAGLQLSGANLFKSGTAFCFGTVTFDQFTGTTDPAWKFPRAHCTFSAIQDLRIGEFSIQGPREKIWLWHPNPNDTFVNNPFDNGAVKFVEEFFANPNDAADLWNYSGWNTGLKLRYAATSNPNNTGSPTDADLNAAQMQALVAPLSGAGLYPPWFQQGPGTVIPGNITGVPFDTTFEGPNGRASVRTTGAINITGVPFDTTLEGANGDVDIGGVRGVNVTGVAFDFDFDGPDGAAQIGSPVNVQGLAPFDTKFEGPNTRAVTLGGGAAAINLIGTPFDTTFEGPSGEPDVAPPSIPDGAAAGRVLRGRVGSARLLHGQVSAGATIQFGRCGTSGVVSGRTRGTTVGSGT